LELSTPSEYLEANLLLLKGEPLVGGFWSRVAPLGETIPQLCGSPPPLLGEKVTLQKGVIFEGEVVIGDRCFIGRNCRIKDSLLWEDCSVGDESLLERSILTERVRLPPGSIVRDRIVIARGREVDLHESESIGENLAFSYQ